MTIMFELHELCGDSSPPLSMLHLEADSLRFSEVATVAPSLEPNQPHCL
jgi:hypothetical protein